MLQPTRRTTSFVELRFFSKRSVASAGASVAVPSLEEDLDIRDGPFLETYLEYERYNGDYRILVTHVLDGDSHETKPWAEFSRDIKLQTLEALPKLIGELLKKVKKQVADV